MWIEIHRLNGLLISWVCHSLRGSVDWNNYQGDFYPITFGHSLRGSVDWNTKENERQVLKLVTPYAGVWIEINFNTTSWGGLSSLPTRECGLKSFCSISVYMFTCHSLRGSVDWNRLFCNTLNHIKGHSLRGSVDWNVKSGSLTRSTIVTPYAGVWIEIGMRWLYRHVRKVTPYAGVWIEM